jgi:hypothetical protein
MTAETFGQAKAEITANTVLMLFLGRVHPIWSAILLMKG